MNRIGENLLKPHPCQCGGFYHTFVTKLSGFSEGSGKRSN